MASPKVPQDLQDPVVPDPEEKTLAHARARQDLKMRWVLLDAVVLSVVASTSADLLYGPPSLPAATAQASWAGLLGWLVKRLFRD